MSNYLKAFGYAPGDYHCQCVACKGNFFGDKRATVCKSCAENTAWKPQHNTPTPYDELGRSFTTLSGEYVTRQNAEEVVAAKNAEIERLKKINSMIMGDDEDAPRYTTKRLKQEVDRITQVIRGEVSDLRADNAAKDARIAELKNAIKVKGGNEHYPTQDAYDLACKAIEKHRDRAAALEADNAALTARVQELENEIIKNGEDEDLEQWFYWRRKAKKAAQRCSNQKAQIAGMTKKATKLEADNKRLREALADTLAALKPHVDTSKKIKEPYEAPLSAYDRGVAALGEVKP